MKSFPPAGSHCEMEGAPRGLSASAAILLLSLLVFSSSARAQIVTDGTVGPAVSLQGPDYRIGHDLGSRAGSNLFHSFRRFGIARGESAVFAGPDDIKNVVSRVTGGEVSNIDGLLRSEVGGADFYFVNPAGVVFGESAKVDVPAAFHVGTADEVRFSDGAVFSASEPGRSVLSVASPESFGFLSPQPASVEVNGSLLEFRPGSSVSLSGGDLSIRGTGENPAGLTVEGGEIRLTAVGERASEVSFSAPVSGAQGSLAMENALVSVGGTGVGKVSIRAGDARLAGSFVGVESYGEEDAAGGVDVEVAGLMEVVDGTMIWTGAYSEGNAGSVRVQAGDLRIEGVEDRFTGVWSFVNEGAVGDAGAVDVQVAGLLEMLDGGQISNATFGEGNGGRVRVQAGDSRIEGMEGRVTGVFNSAHSGSAGSAGDIALKTVGTLEISDGGGIASKAFAEGDAGRVEVEAGEVALHDGGEISSDTLGGGDAGTVSVRTGSLRIEGPLGGVSSRAYPESTGAAGTVEVEATGWLGILDGGSVSSETWGSADAGELRLKVGGLLEIVDGGQVSSGTFGEGNGGSVEIEAGELRIDNRGVDGRFTGVASEADPESAGDAGTVSVQVAGDLEMLNGAEISSSSFGRGKAGSVEIRAGEIEVDGGSASFTLISSLTFGEGDGGRVKIDAEKLTLLDGAWISSGTSGAGDGGSVEIRARDLAMKGRARISTETVRDSAGRGGRVEVKVSGAMEMLGGAEISSSTGGTGNGGIVEIQAGRLRMEGGGSGTFTGILSRANPGSAGNAGTVEVEVDGLTEMFGEAEIASDTFAQGDAGNVRVEAGELRIHELGAENLFAGISSLAGVDAAGKAGTVEVKVGGLLEMLAGRWISSLSAGSGDAGTVKVEAGELKLTEGAQISTSSFDRGDAGDVLVSAERIGIDGRGEEGLTGIFSRSFGVGGFAGDVRVRARRLKVSNGGSVSIAHYGEAPLEGLESFQGGTLLVEADSVELQRGSEISASSTGNVPASSVEISVGDKLIVEGSSRITTSAAAGDGGPVSIGGPGCVLLRDGLITTSTEGGRGGDIVLSPEILVLDTGFVQANTAEGAQGGDISVGSQAVIAEGNRIEIGGEERLEFRAGSGMNVIQAAAPRGNPGNIVVVAPEVDVAAALADAGAGYVAPVRLATDPCLAEGGKGGGSLTLGGRGGVPAGPEDAAISSLREDWLDWLLEPR